MDTSRRKLAFGLVAIALIAMSVVQLPFFASRAVSVSYSEFKALLKAAKVADLTLGKETISGSLSAVGLEGLLPKERVEELKRLGGGTRPFVTARVDDPGLVAELEQANVRFGGRVENTWLSTLLSWILPALVFVGVWVLVMRRFGPQPGLMASARARPRSTSRTRPV